MEGCQCADSQSGRVSSRMIGISLSPLTRSPEYKRIFAFRGDLYFQAPRRHALSVMYTECLELCCVILTDQVLTFSELVWKRNKYILGLGSFHLQPFAKRLTVARGWGCDK